MNLSTALMNLIARMMVIGLAFPLHESAHAWAAAKLGDPTARQGGRVNFNPLAHLDLLPTAGMLAASFAADLLLKNSSVGNMLLLLTSVLFFHPVPVNPFYFKNRKAGMALTALAGPAANILLGMLFLIAYKVVVYFLPYTAFFGALGSILFVIISINLQLAAFNLLPIPPLDGSKVLGFFVSDRVRFKMMQYERTIMIGLFVVLYGTSLLDPVLYWGYRGLFVVIDVLTKWIDLLAGVLG